MKTLEYGWAYLRFLRSASSGRELFATLKHTARACNAAADDIACAVYWFSSAWYDGQRDPLYSSMCVNPFKPGCLSDGPDTDVACAIVDAMEDTARANGY